MSDRACSSRKDMTSRAQASSQKMSRPSNHPPPLPGDGLFLRRRNASSHEASARRVGWFAVRQSDEPGRVARLGVCRRGTSPPTSGRRGRPETPTTRMRVKDSSAWSPMGSRRQSPTVLPARRCQARQNPKGVAESRPRHSAPRAASLDADYIFRPLEGAWQVAVTLGEAV